jgi:hypothetical protein
MCVCVCVCVHMCEYKHIYVHEFIHAYLFISASPILFEIDWQVFIEVRANVMPLENCNGIKHNEYKINLG